MQKKIEGGRERNRSDGDWEEKGIWRVPARAASHVGGDGEPGRWGTSAAGARRVSWRKRRVRKFPGQGSSGEILWSVVCGFVLSVVCGFGWHQSSVLSEEKNNPPPGGCKKTLRPPHRAQKFAPDSAPPGGAGGGRMVARSARVTPRRNSRKVGTPKASPPRPGWVIRRGQWFAQDPEGGPADFFNKKKLAGWIRDQREMAILIDKFEFLGTYRH